MDRRQQLFNAKPRQPPDSALISTHVNFQFRKEDPRRQRGDLRTLTPDEKALCALRKVLAQMSTETGGRHRYFVGGTHCRILERHVSPGAKEGDPGSYRVRGRCQLGISHHTDGASHKMIQFVVSFRDTQDPMGLADVEYFDPTTIDELDPRTSL